MSGVSNGGIVPESPCAICRSYGHFTHNHPEGYVNPMYDALGDKPVDEAERLRIEAFDCEFVPYCDTEGL